jgi:enamine deaminase RidA (YjgF/YER057c/UK114 family)
MGIVRHDSSSILSNAVEHGDTVYLAGVVADAKNLPARACVEAKLADPRALVEIMVVAAK